MNRWIWCICCTAALLLLGHNIAHAQLSGPLGNAGTDFWLSFPANWTDGSTDGHVKLYITAEVRTRVMVTSGTTLIATEMTTANGVLEMTLPRNVAEVVSRTDNDPVPDDGIYAGRGLHIESDDPIVVYAVNRAGFTTDGLLALPVGALGREYIVASSADVASGSAQRLPSQYVITAPYNATSVTIINSFDTPNHQAGDTVTVVLNRGDVYSAMSNGALGDLSGTLITASSPVSVLAGQNCTYLPNAQYPACDHLVEQLLPVESWGRTYHMMPFATRLKADMIRVFAGAPDADINVNGQHLATLARKGGVEGEGWLELLPNEREPLVITSSKPIHVMQYNNSQQYDGVQSDPFMLALIPQEQYQSDVTFMTPGSEYPKNYINLVTDSANYYQLEIASSPTGAWENLSARYQPSARVLNGGVDDTITHVGVTFQLPAGIHRIRGSRGFAGYLYGFSNYDSYGYPLAAATADFISGDTTAPVSTHTIDCDGTVRGLIDDRYSTNASGVAGVQLLGAESQNYSFTLLKPFAPRIDDRAGYMLVVNDITKPAHAVVLAADAAGNLVGDTIDYQPTQLALLQAVRDEFDTTSSANDTIRLDVRVENRSEGTIEISELFLSDTVNFQLVGVSLPITLAPGEFRVFEVRFSAAEDGTYSAVLGMREECGEKRLATFAVTIEAPTRVNGPTIPGEATILAIAPNPVDGTTATIRYRLSRPGAVVLELYSEDGRLVRRWIDDEPHGAVEHRQTVSVDGLTAGRYFCRLSVGGRSVVLPMVVR